MLGEEREPLGAHRQRGVHGSGGREVVDDGNVQALSRWDDLAVVQFHADPLEVAEGYAHRAPPRAGRPSRYCAAKPTPSSTEPESDHGLVPLAPLVAQVVERGPGAYVRLGWKKALELEA